MATTTDVGTGEDVVDITAWEAVVAATGGDQVANIISDITDTNFFSGWAAGTVTIKGDTTGNAKRTVAAAGGGVTFHFADVDTTAVVVQDLIFTGSTSAAINAQNGGSFTMERCKLTGQGTMAMNIPSSALCLVHDINNCIFEDAGTYSVVDLKTTAASVLTFKNCLFTGSGTEQANLGNNANLVVHYYNCVSFDNTGDDFADGATACVTNLTSCVSKDATAVTGHDSTTTCVGTNADLAAYFTDHVSGDYTLLQSGFDSWGINGSAVNTPAEDYASVIRSNDDIGPYEFISADHRRIPRRIDRRIARRIAHR